MMSIAELEINDRRFEFNLKLLKYLVSNLGNLKSDVPTADLSELLQPLVITSEESFSPIHP